jgi:hypothetical protein
MVLEPSKAPLSFFFDSLFCFVFNVYPIIF